jgi:hypothetical protein
VRTKLPCSVTGRVLLFLVRAEMIAHFERQRWIVLEKL